MKQSVSERPLVAIATPVYNGERHLADTMACVQASDYPNLVHVIVDNASTDTTSQIIARHENGRVPLLVARNTSMIPMIANFNAAINLVPQNAVYFRLLCADDLITPDYVSRKVEIAERNSNVNIVGCLERSDHVRAETLPTDQTSFSGHDIARSYLRRENTVLSGTHFLYRKLPFTLAHPFYDDALLPYIDADANLRACLTGGFGFINEGLAIRREHDRNAWHDHSRSGDTAVDWLHLLVRYGTRVMNANDYQRCLIQYRRHCLRRLLILRWRHGDTANFRRHTNRLESIGEKVRWFDFADALVDWAWLAATGRRHTVGYAHSA